jgi:hypothetical protein
LPNLYQKGEPLWLSGKVMERENKQNQKIPGSLPSLGNLKKPLSKDRKILQIARIYTNLFHYKAL